MLGRGVHDTGGGGAGAVGRAAAAPAWLVGDGTGVGNGVAAADPAAADVGPLPPLPNALGPPPANVCHGPQSSIAVRKTVAAPPALAWLMKKVNVAVPGASVTVAGGVIAWSSWSRTTAPVAAVKLIDRSWTLLAVA